jgi:hypothetical protein
LDDFGEPIYTDESGMQFRVRQSDSSVYTYRPKTNELVFVCTVKQWPKVAKKFGLKLVPRAKPATTNKQTKKAST